MASAKVKSGRSLWWIVHHWAGLKLSLLMTFVLLTGTLATLSNEIDWLITPVMRAMPQEGAMAGWDRWYAAASLPGATVEELRLPIGAGFAAQAKIIDRDGATRLVHINPWSAQVQGVTSTATAQRLFRDLHRRLMLPGDIGIVLVGLLSLPLLATLVTAFKVYKKWWRGFRRWPRPMRDRSREMRRYIGDLHRLAGLWSLWFLAVIGLTGLWYLAERLGADAIEPEPPAVVSRTTTLKPGKLRAMITTTHEQWPELAIRGVAIQDGVVGIEGQAQAVLVRDRANVIWFDANTARILGMTDATGLSAHQRLSEAADPLHFGTWGHLPTKLLWFLFGALLSALSITGLLICAYRVGSATARGGPLTKAMGVGGIIGIGLIGYALVMLIL